MMPSLLPAAPKFIPEKEIVIPNDGNLSSFTTDDMCTFFKHMGIEDRIVNFLQKKSLDGKKFSKLKDNDLETIGISNPVIIHFREITTVKDSHQLLVLLKENISLTHCC